MPQRPSRMAIMQCIWRTCDVQKQAKKIFHFFPGNISYSKGTKAKGCAASQIAHGPWTVAKVSVTVLSHVNLEEMIKPRISLTILDSLVECDPVLWAFLRCKWHQKTIWNSGGSSWSLPQVNALFVFYIDLSTIPWCLAMYVHASI